MTPPEKSPRGHTTAMSRWVIALTLAAWGGLGVVDVVRSEPASPGALSRLRGDAASSQANDLGGPSRRGRLARSLSGEQHSVIERIALPGRRATAPLEWREGRIVLGTAEGLFVRDRDGQSVSLPLGPIDLRPALLPSNELLVLTREGRVLVLDRHLRVRVETRGGASMRAAPLVLADGSIVVVSADHTVTRYDSDLQRVFSTPLPRLTSAQVQSPALLQDPNDTSSARIAVADGERLHVLDLTGVLLRSVDVGERIVSAPVVDDAGDVHVLTQSGHIVVITRAVRVGVRLPLGGRFHDQNAMLALDDDGSYRVAVQTLGVLALERDGTERWSASTDAPFHGPLAVCAEGTTLAFDRRGRIAVVSRAGQIVERIELGGIVVGFPMLGSDGTLWASTDAAELIHVGPTPRPEP